MITKTLDELNIKSYSITAIPDIHDPPNWVEFVRKCIQDFDVVIANNKVTIQLFEENGFLVDHTPKYKRNIYSGKEIRSRIAQNREWQSLVPVAVVEVITKIDGIHRIQQI